MALHTSREQIGIPQPSSAKQPWGVVMDWGVTSGTATVVGFSDGSASIYLSSGGGYIGGQGHESIRRAAQNAVAAASDSLSQLQLTSNFPLPQRGEVIFYVLTDSGVYTGRASEVQLRTHQHSLSKLNDAAQEIVTQYRLIQP